MADGLSTYNCRAESGNRQQPQHYLAEARKAQERLVHRQRCNGGAARGCQSRTCAIGLQTEVIAPALLQRMKEWRFVAGSRVDRGNAITLVQTEIRTLQSKIMQFGGPAATSRNDMIDVKRCAVPNLPEATAPALSCVAIPNGVSQ